MMEKTLTDFLQRIKVTNQFRYERKFTAEGYSRQRILYYIKNHPALFREIFHKRQVNNIYFDTPAKQYYDDNVIGLAARKKIRIRWYGEVFGTIHQPKLEFKIKQGLVGDKWTFNLPPFELTRNTSINWEDLFRRADLPAPIREQLRELSPNLLNFYHRSYFRSADQRFRLTLDSQLGFYLLNRTFHNFSIERQSKSLHILELKYNLQAAEAADTISNHFPFRMDKFSKYVTGLESTQK